MNTLHLHIGLHKTGTTALQRFLSDNSKALSERGLHRLSTGLPPNEDTNWGHHDLAWALRDGDSKGLWKTAGDEARHHSQVIVTSEEFAFIRKAALYSPIQQAFHGWRVQPICYLRRQDQLLESIYNHHVKSLGEISDIMEFSAKVSGRLDYMGILSAATKAFGGVTVRLYEQAHFVGDDLFDDFLLAIGVECSTGLVKPSKNINAGLTGEGLRLMLEANRQHRDDPETLNRVRREILSTHASPAFQKHSLLTDEQRGNLMSRLADMNTAIARKYFGRSHLWTR